MTVIEKIIMKNSPKWLIYILLPLLIRACPDKCICKWKGGKQTVECQERGYVAIPSGIDQGTQVLDFSGNNLHSLLRDRFERLGLVNLQRIYLSRCKITQIDDRAFRGLTNLVELDLSYNQLMNLPSKTFVDYPSLMRLSLSGNPIRTIHSAAFRPLSFLTSLELSNCQIETIEDGSFVGLGNLEWLKLDGNQINFIRGENILPNPLHGISLERNPWQCDCRLLEVHNWLLNYKVPHSVEPQCAGPSRLTGEQIKSLSVADLACLPDVSPTTLYLEIAEGKNISLMCRVSAIPEASVSWWFRGRILQNDSTLLPGFHFYYFIEEGHEEKRSELYIFNTNTEDNGTFVCAAENSAGRTSSNYTIRIIVKEEPVVGLIVFPFEYVVAVCAAVTLSCLIVLVILGVLLVKCRQQRRKKKKKERSKDGSTSVQNRKPVVRPAAVSSSPIKANGTLVDSQITIDQAIPTQVSLPSEQNPDLINGTDSVGGEDSIVHFQGPVVINNPRYLSHTFLQHHLSADVHLSPGRFLDGEGYPMDFGLPKVPLLVAIPETQMSFYRTLPHKRPAKLSAAMPQQRLTREAEFLNHAHYECDPADVRYTIEGYPCYAAAEQGSYSAAATREGFPPPPPPAAFKTDHPPAWPHFQRKILPPDVHPMRPIAQCSVAAQTNPESECDHSNIKFPLRVSQMILTESPDEGYVGETAEATEI